MKKLLAYAIALTLVTGCATRGAGYVPLVDMKGRDAAQFNIDTAECQAYATQRLDAASGAAAGAIAGALLGALLMPRGFRNYGAAHGAVFGALGGAVGANDTQESITKRCLAGRGYNVLN